MPDKRRQNCMCCGKPASEVGPISWRGNCSECGLILLYENAHGISAKQGPAHRRRLRGLAEYLQREMLDAAQSGP